MTRPHDIPLDARRYWLLLAVFEQLRSTRFQNDLHSLLPEGKDSIAPGDPDAEWGEDTDALLVIRPLSASTRSVIGGEEPTHEIQVVLEWSFDHHDETNHFWETQVFDAVDEALSQFSPGQYTALGSSGGIDPQPDGDRNRYLADATYGFRTTLED